MAASARSAAWISPRPAVETEKRGPAIMPPSSSPDERASLRQRTGALTVGWLVANAIGLIAREKMRNLTLARALEKRPKTAPDGRR